MNLKEWSIVGKDSNPPHQFYSYCRFNGAGKCVAFVACKWNVSISCIIYPHGHKILDTTNKDVAIQSTVKKKINVWLRKIKAIHIATGNDIDVSKFVCDLKLIELGYILDKSLI